MNAPLDIGVPYQVRRSARAKRLQAAVRDGQVEVVVPKGARSGHVRAFVAEAAPWIVARVARLERDGGTVLPARCVTGATLQLEGVTTPLAIERARTRRVRIERGETLVLTVPASIAEDAIEARARRALESWFRERAREVARAHVEAYAPRLGRRPRGIRIKGQRTVWGSCGRTGLINLNWRLIGAPPPVFEYIVVHELCHLVERNHGPRFWRLVGELMPGYETQKDWLRRHGMRLG